MIDYTNTYSFLESQKTLNAWLPQLKIDVERVLAGTRWGDLPKWIDALNELPEVKPTHISLNSDRITVGQDADLDDDFKKQLNTTLHKLHPWRKGPFNLFGTHIDTEWRSDLKWDRLKSGITSLENRAVLDVGCGSGYHCWRMKGAGAATVIGIDPTMIYPVQFQVFQKYIQDPSVCVFPLGVDDMPQHTPMFDTVFSMGLLYHRRSPFDHLLQLQGFLRSGGELVLETLVIEGDKGDVLSPFERYAKMANVWFIPSAATLKDWLERTGFVDVKIIDVTKTTTDEQRMTEWIDSHSLAEFLDPQDSSKTVEGYPAPQRATLVATAK